MSQVRMRRDQSAASSVLTFLIAGLIFMGSVGAVLVMSRGSGSGVAASQAPAAVLNDQAQSLAQLLLHSPGYAADGGDWVAGSAGTTGAFAGANGLLRLGLRDGSSSDPTLLNFSKFQNLRRAPYAANPSDGYVNYEEARADLGLAQSDLDFHIRAYPTLQNMTQILAHGYHDPNLRVTYIGHYTVTYTYTTAAPPSPAYNLTVTQPTCAVLDDATAQLDNANSGAGNPTGSPQNYRLRAIVTNGGSTTTQFTGTFTYTLGGVSGTQNANTFLVPARSTSTIYVDVPAITGVTCAAGSTIKVAVQDPTTVTVTNSTTLAAAVTGATSSPRDLKLDSTKAYFLAGTGNCADPVKLNWDSSNIGSNDKLAIKVVDRDTGTQVWPSSGYYTFNGNSGNKATQIVGCMAAGTYVAYLYYYGSGSAPVATSEHVTERILVVSGSSAAPSGYVAPGIVVQGPPSYTSTSQGATETADLRTLVQRFCPSFYSSKTVTPLPVVAPGGAPDWDGNGVADASDDWTHRCASFATAPTDVRTAQPGDVFADSKQSIDDDLPTRLLDASGNPRYDVTNVLVVGSDVSHTALTSGAPKFAVRDWVLGGGILIVFGSAAQTANWLEPLFDAAIRSSSGGLGTPDPGNAVLHSSDELDYPHYANDDRVWNFNGQTGQNAAALFDNVVVEGSDPVMTLSNPGAFGNGRVILTTWQPFDLYDGHRDAITTQLEGMKLIHNLLVQGYQNLFLDYGPPLPSHQNVVPAVRYAEIADPDFTDPIQLSVVVFVFK